MAHEISDEPGKARKVAILWSPQFSRDPHSSCRTSNDILRTLATSAWRWGAFVPVMAREAETRRNHVTLFSTRLRSSSPSLLPTNANPPSPPEGPKTSSLSSPSSRHCLHSALRPTATTHSFGTLSAAIVNSPAFFYDGDPVWVFRRNLRNCRACHLSAHWIDARD